MAGRWHRLSLWCCSAPGSSLSRWVSQLSVLAPGFWASGYEGASRVWHSTRLTNPRLRRLPVAFDLYIFGPFGDGRTVAQASACGVALLPGSSLSRWVSQLAGFAPGFWASGFQRAGKALDELLVRVGFRRAQQTRTSTIGAEAASSPRGQIAGAWLRWQY